MKRGAPSIFGPKDPRTRFQGIQTTVGGRRLDAAKQRLEVLYAMVTGQTWGAVSDADAVEFLGRGVSETRKYLAKKKGR